VNNFFDFTGKVVLVTGASSGIGRATAELFGSMGASVALTYLNNQKGAEEAAASISGSTMALRVDVGHNLEVTKMVRDVEEGLGPIDILVNNAGSLVERLRTLELTEERWDEVMNLNAKSAFFAAQAAIPKMLEKGGSIINVTSIAGRNGGAPGSIHYSSGKAAMLTMTKGLAKEFATQGIRVNAVSPGVIDTPYHETFTAPEVMENLKKTIPMGRAGRPDEVASVIAFLASDAASYLCGETIEINGGLLMD
jgi:NAD(P)-dependent dehydrogenase (short-subunit alcohol dehydrogenase family)